MKKRIFFKIEYYILIAFIKIICLFSLKTRYAVASFLGKVFYYIGKERRNITIKNIKAAFPEYSDVKVKEVALESYINISKSFMEVFWIDELSLNFIGKENIEKALERGKGVILVSMHFGNWEYGGYMVAKSGFTLKAVAKRQKNMYINELINKKRETSGMKVIPKGKSFKSIVKVLKDNEVLGLIADQYSNETRVKFFGIDTAAIEGPARLSEKYGSALIFIYAVREKENTYTLYASEEIDYADTGDEEENIKINTQKIFNEMEKVIRKNPEQWFWQHKRWKDTIKY